MPHRRWSSTSEAFRLIEQGGVRVNGEKITDKKVVISTSSESTLIQVGKRKFKKVGFEVE
jgi:tyrosyl-tRNA synthetase